LTAGVCIIHLIRNTFRLASKRDWDALKRDVAPIYTAPNSEAARVALDELADRWGKRYAAIIRVWENAWTEFIPFLDYDVEIRKVLCSTNAIESLNARCRRAVRARGHFPTEQAALKCLYLVTRSLDPPGKAAHDGQRAGNQHSTRSPPPSPTAGRQQKPTNEDRRKHRSCYRPNPIGAGRRKRQDCAALHLQAAARVRISLGTSLGILTHGAQWRQSGAGSRWCGC
jgi:hypothetical protein